jgi:hypothetical protein
MKEPRSTISIIELKRLLIELTEKRSDIGIRFRFMGELWSVNFFRIVTVTDKGALFKNEISQKFVAVSDLSSVIQFEIDTRFQNFQPFYHYDVKPMSEFKIASDLPGEPS